MRDWEFAVQLTLAKTGMRPGELCHLLIEVLRELLKAHLGGRVAGPVFLRPQFVGEEADADRAALSRLLEKRISKHRERFGGEPTRVERSGLATQVWMEAGELDPDQVRRSFIRIANRAGMAGVSCPKRWRHTFATLLQDANVDPLLRQLTLGHKPSGAGGALGMTAVYTHSRPETHTAEIRRALRYWPDSLLLARQHLTKQRADTSSTNTPEP